MAGTPPPGARAIRTPTYNLPWYVLALAALAACAVSLEGQLWQAARKTDTIQSYEEFLERFPDGIPSDQARKRLQQLYDALHAVDAVHLEVEQVYMYGSADREIEDYDLPIGETLAVLLRHAGLTVVTDSLKATNGVMRVRVEGRAMSQPYAPANERNLATSGAVTRQYAGASLRGSMTLTTAEGTLYEQAFAGIEAPPERMGSADFPRPEDAPFEAAFRKALAPELALMMGRLYGPRLLIGVLEEQDLTLQKVAVEALGERGDTTAVAALLTALEATANFDLTRKIVAALGNTGDRRATDTLIDVMHTAFDPALRESATRALGQIGDIDAVPRLIEVLGSDARSVRRQAAVALNAITGQSFGTDAEAWQRWWQQSQGAEP